MALGDKPDLISIMNELEIPVNGVNGLVECNAKSGNPNWGLLEYGGYEWADLTLSSNSVTLAWDQTLEFSTIEIRAKISATIESNNDWIETTINMPSVNGTGYIRAKSNNLFQARSGSVTVRAGSQTKTIQVTQLSSSGQ